MKKSIILVLMAVIAIPSASLFAEEGITATAIQEAPTRQNIVKERLAKQRQNYLENLQEARRIAEEYRTTTNPEDRRELRQEARNGFLVRLTNAAQKLSDMQSRVEERIITAEERGYNTDTAREKLEDSQKYLALVLDEQEKLKEIITNDQDEETVTKEEAKAIFETIKENFGLSRKALLEAIQSLKQTVLEENNKEEKDEEVEDEAINVQETQ
jgi:hypothetical protein